MLSALPGRNVKGRWRADRVPLERRCLIWSRRRGYAEVRSWEIRGLGRLVLQCSSQWLLQTVFRSCESELSARDAGLWGGMHSRELFSRGNLSVQGGDATDAQGDLGRRRLKVLILAFVCAARATRVLARVQLPDEKQDGSSECDGDRCEIHAWPCFYATFL